MPGKRPLQERLLRKPLSRRRPRLRPKPPPLKRPDREQWNPARRTISVNIGANTNRSAAGFRYGLYQVLDCEANDARYPPLSATAGTCPHNTRSCQGLLNCLCYQRRPYTGDPAFACSGAIHAPILWSSPMASHWPECSTILPLVIRRVVAPSTLPVLPVAGKPILLVAITGNVERHAQSLMSAIAAHARQVMLVGCDGVRRLKRAVCFRER